MKQADERSPRGLDAVGERTPAEHHVVRRAISGAPGREPEPLERGGDLADAPAGLDDARALALAEALDSAGPKPASWTSDMRRRMSSRCPAASRSVGSAANR